MKLEEAIKVAKVEIILDGYEGKGMPLAWRRYQNTRRKILAYSINHIGITDYSFHNGYFYGADGLKIIKNKKSHLYNSQVRGKTDWEVYRYEARRST